MTIIDEQNAQPLSDDAQLLFQEAKQRRRRRWLISGITTLVLLVLIGVTLGITSGRGGHARPKSVGLPASITGASHSVTNLNFRPVLCYAPPLTLAPGQTASTGPLPTCSPSTELTASNLQVSPNSNNVNGYTSSSKVQPDPKFASYPSTAPAKDNNDDTVLLPGIPAEGVGRYVLGPAALTGQGVKSASAQMNNGQWTVNLVLTDRGSTEWDALTLAQFHQLIGVVLNGKVISAPITQPVQSSWTSFNGQVQISGAFTQHQAKAIAAEL
ncbi:MAG: SecDF P1 head subdomain-containing protein [Acidimicrobiales bacterium]